MKECKLTVLISCMYEKNFSIIQRSNVQTDVVVINQCDNDSVSRFTFVNKYGKECHACFVNTTERGLSKSRNMAIKYAQNDLCLVCDDDEYLEDDYETKIIDAHKKNSSSIIAFSLKRNDRNDITYPLNSQKLSFRQILKTSSRQITFKREDVLKKNISFDLKMGSGTGNGGGEENKFLLDCRSKGLKLYYYPEPIAIINPGDSKWFHGYTEDFFRNQGWVSKRLLGLILGYTYIWYYAFSHVQLFKKDITITKVIYNLHKGFFETR